MSKVIEHRRYVKSDYVNNNNKYWYATLYDNNTVITEYGRVGNSPQTSTKSFGSAHAAKSFFEKKCKEKEKGKRDEIPYERVEVVEGTESNIISPNASLKEVAKQQIQTDSPETTALIEYLAEKNVHSILENTTMTFNKSTGLFETPCGIVTRSTISKARDLLVEMSRTIEDYENGNKKALSEHEYGQRCNKYLMLIPQDVGRKWTPETLYRSMNDIKKQNDILDSLTASLDTVEKDRSKLVKEAEETGEVPKIFSVKLEHVTDSATLDKIRKLYEGTKKNMHSCSHLKIKKVYTVEIETMAEAFEKKGRVLGNVWELWHGTRVSNLLSILKVGLIVPPANASHVCGRMFGPGCYFSDQSTKALNYAYGYWGGSRDDNCFMFLADVAMGKYCIPTGPGRNYPLKGYDSTYAIGGKSGVMNNEMIVPNLYQCNLKYLVQFGK